MTSNTILTAAAEIIGNDSSYESLNKKVLFDVIKGKVANDKVFRVVDMYKRNIWDKERAIKEIRVYQTYDQTAFITQYAIDVMLSFKGHIEVAL